MNWFKSNGWVPALAAMLVSVCWGANFTASRFAMEHFPPFFTVLLRFVLVCVLLLPFVLRHRMPPWRDALVISFLYITMHFALIFFAMAQGLNITSAIVASQMGVPFSCVLAAIFFRDFLGPWRSFGLLVSFAGLLVISGTPNVDAHWGAFLIATLGALAWAGANIYMKRMKPQPVVSMLFWPGLFALPQMLLLSGLFETPSLTLISSAPLSAWAGIFYSALFSSIVGYGLWMWLLGRYSMTQVVPYSLLVPVVGIGCGVLIFAEPLTPLILSGAALVVTGVAIITIRRPKLAELEKL